jgi:hypothetical protein
MYFWVCSYRNQLDFGYNLSNRNLSITYFSRLVFNQPDALIFLPSPNYAIRYRMFIVKLAGEWRLEPEYVVCSVGIRVKCFIYVGLAQGFDMTVVVSISCFETPRDAAPIQLGSYCRSYRCNGVNAYTRYKIRLEVWEDKEFELIRGSREFQRFILFVTERFFGTTNDLIMKFVWRASGSRSSIIQFVYLGTLSEYVEPPEREWLGKWFPRVVSYKAFYKLFLQIFLVAQGCADNYTNPPCLSLCCCFIIIFYLLSIRQRSYRSTLGTCT